MLKFYINGGKALCTTEYYKKYGLSVAGNFICTWIYRKLISCRNEFTILHKKLISYEPTDTKKVTKTVHFYISVVMCKATKPDHYKHSKKNKVVFNQNNI